MFMERDIRCDLVKLDSDNCPSNDYIGERSRHSRSRLDFRSFGLSRSKNKREWRVKEEALADAAKASVLRIIYQAIYGVPLTCAGTASSSLMAIQGRGLQQGQRATLGGSRRWLRRLIPP